MTVALYFVGEELENLKRTNKQTDREHTENSKPEATLIPVDCWGERANIYIYIFIPNDMLSLDTET